MSGAALAVSDLGVSVERPSGRFRAVDGVSFEVERGETVGILSVRDVVRCWTEDGAICPVPASAAVG